MNEVKLKDGYGDIIYINFKNGEPELLIEEGVESFLLDERHIGVLEQVLFTLKTTR